LSSLSPSVSVPRTPVVVRLVTFCSLSFSTTLRGKWPESALLSCCLCWLGQNLTRCMWFRSRGTQGRTRVVERERTRIHLLEWFQDGSGPV
jgi:hypothetical protein